MKVGLTKRDTFKEILLVVNKELSTILKMNGTSNAVLLYGFYFNGNR